MRRDPRPSLPALHRDHQAYISRVRDRSNALVCDRLILPEDVAAYVEAASRPEIVKRFARKRADTQGIP